MASTVVDRLRGEFAGLIAVLDKAGEISLRSTADDNLRKALLLAAASHFEHRITEEVLFFVSETTNDHGLTTSLVRNKAVSRQYHSWFNWDAKNANSFFALFGEEFRNFMKNKVDKDDVLDSSIRRFLEIGSIRNRLLHQDFGSFFLEKTSDEIYDLYRSAMTFVDAFPLALREFSVALAGLRDQLEEGEDHAEPRPAPEHGNS